MNEYNAPFSARNRSFYSGPVDRKSRNTGDELHMKNRISDAVFDCYICPGMHENILLNAVIFDVDGLMLDTERIARDTFKQASAELGFPGMTDGDFSQIIGRSIPDAEIIMQSRYGTSYPYREVKRCMREYGREYFKKGTELRKPGLMVMLDLLDAKNIPKAVATSSSREETFEKLFASGLSGRFSTVVCGDDIRHSKPHPEIFLKAAEALGVLPVNTMVLEDSEPGIIAASRAGMQPVLIPDLSPLSDDCRSRAHLVFDSLEQAAEYLELALAASGT